MEQPEGYVEPGAHQKVCRLRRAIYGLKQAGRQLLARLFTVLKGLGFVPSYTDDCVLHRDNITILVYVDDFIIIAPKEDEAWKVVSDLEKEFPLKRLGVPKKFLGMVKSSVIAKTVQLPCTRSTMRSASSNALGWRTRSLSRHQWSQVSVLGTTKKEKKRTNKLLNVSAHTLAVQLEAKADSPCGAQACSSVHQRYDDDGTRTGLKGCR